MTIETKGALAAVELNALFATNNWQVEDLGKLERSLDSSWRWVTARDQAGQLVGFVQAISDGIRHVYILKMIVHPSCRKQGVGTAIMCELMKVIGEEGMLPTLVATPGNGSFYAKFGFKSECKGLKAMCIR